MAADQEFLPYPEPEFWPPGSERSTEGLSVEIRPGDFFRETGRWQVTMWITRGRSGSGHGLPTDFPTVEKARRVARVMYALIHDDHLEMERLREERWRTTAAELKVEAEARAQVQAEERAERMAKITPETERVEKWECPTCSHVDDPSAFEMAVYECSRCGGTQAGDAGNRCETDNIFMAKVSDCGCPSCEEPVEEPETLTGVEIDGVFIPESEIEEVTA